MRIKKVIIQGFGSYNKAENPEEFGPGINAIRKPNFILIIYSGS